jgi:predicted ArsR family transcriptional regulator
VDQEEDPAIRAVAALDEPSRRGMYAFIRSARRPVTRDEAAAAVGISRKLAAFHLDKLVEAGVLVAGSARSGRIGRAPKVYEPSDVDIRVTIPPRSHDLLADVLIDAVLPSPDAQDAARRAAQAHGETLGAEERSRTRPGRLGSERALTRAAELLARHGFEPTRDTPTCVRLRNCPFHPLAARATELVCGVNQAFLSGVLTGLGATTVQAVLAPRAGECCVELRA